MGETWHWHELTPLLHQHLQGNHFVRCVCVCLSAAAYDALAEKIEAPSHTEDNRSTTQAASSTPSLSPEELKLIAVFAALRSASPTFPNRIAPAEDDLVCAFFFDLFGSSLLGAHCLFYLGTLATPLTTCSFLLFCIGWSGMSCPCPCGFPLRDPHPALCCSVPLPGLASELAGATCDRP